MAEYDFESIDTVALTRRFHVSEKVLLLLKGTGTTRIFVQTSMIVRFQNAKKQTQIAIQHADLDTLTLFCIVIIFNKGQRSWSCEQLNVRRDAIPNSDAYRTNYILELLGYETCVIATGLRFNNQLLAFSVHRSHAILYDSMNPIEWIYICNTTI